LVERRLANECGRLKLKRPQAAKKFREHLDEMYETALQEEQANKKTKAKL
jgi:long-chain acyl-CoA synthetase